MTDKVTGHFQRVSPGILSVIDGTYRMFQVILRLMIVSIRVAAGCGLFGALTCPAAIGQIKFVGSVTTIAPIAASFPLPTQAALAVDTAGNIYVTDEANRRVLKLTAGTYEQSVVATNVSGAVAVDSDGNVYIANRLFSGTVLKETPAKGGGYTESQITDGPFNVWMGIAADSAGNVYLSGNNQVIKEAPSSGGYTQTIVAQNLRAPVGVAVDSKGNVYVAENTINYGNGDVLKETPSAGSYVQTVIASTTTTGMYNPNGVAVDASGNVYIASGYGVLKESPSSGGSYTGTVIPFSSSLASSITPIGVGVDGNGTVYAFDSQSSFSVYKQSSQGGSFGVVDVGATSSGPVYLSFAPVAGDYSDLVGNVTVKGPDFTEHSSLSTCKGRLNFYPTDLCIIAVDFTPQGTGLRTTTVTLNDTQGNTLTVNLQGTGGAPQASFIPGNQIVVASTAAPFGLNGPQGVAIDGSGNIYIADTGNKRVLKETPSTGGYTQTLVAAPTNGSSIINIEGIAVDASGNVYIEDGTRLLKETPTASGYAESLIANRAGRGIALDSSGNIYVDTGTGVVKETLSGGSYTESTVIPYNSGLYSIGIAVDNKNNLYITDATSQQVFKETPSGIGYTQSVVASGLGYPWGVTVDSNGNVYIGDEGGPLLKETPSGGTYTQTVLNPAVGPAGAVAYTGVPYGVALDSKGNVYVADAYLSKVWEFDLVDPLSLSFASTAVGSTSSDSPRVITLANVGNGPLIFSVLSAVNPSISVNFTLDGATTCPTVSSTSGPASLAPGATCLYSIRFSPTAAGTISGSLVLTDNSLNVTNATQTLVLNGMGTSATAPSVTLSSTTLTFASQTTGTTSAAQTVTMTNSGQAALTVNSITSSGDFTQTNSCGTSVAVGANCTISVTFTPTVVGNRTGTITVTDNASGSPQTVVLSGKGTASGGGGSTPGIALSPTSLSFPSQAIGTTGSIQTVTLTNSGQATLMLSSVTVSGDFAQTNTCGTSVAAGANCTISVKFTPTAAGGRTGTVTITDNASGSPHTVALSGIGVSFGISFSSTSLTASSGASTTATIQIAPVNGFTGTVNLTCVVNYQGQGTPSSPPTCSLSPSQVQISSTSPISSTLTVSTTAATAVLIPGWALKGSGVALAVMLFGGVPRRCWRSRLLAVLCLAAIGGMSSCSGGKSSGGNQNPNPTNTGTTKGSYQVVVAAMSGTATTSTTIPLTVQ